MSLRSRKKARTLAAIRDAARRLFAERGYEATRTRDIAEAAGIATGTLFNYAPTKRDVVLLLWKERARAAAAEGLQAARASADPVAACMLLFHPIFSFYGEDLELGRIFLDAAVYAQQDAELAAINVGFVQDIAAMLLPHAGGGAFLAATNVFAAYYLVLSMMLSGQLGGPEQAGQLLGELVRVQSRGWTPG